MAITREQVRRAIENYLPSSISVSQDSETNTVDPEKVFAKLQTMVAASIITDPNSIYYLVALSLAEIADLIQTSFNSIDKLTSKDILYSAEQTDPDSVVSSTELRKALSALSGLSSDSGKESASSFDTAIQAFQTAHLNELTQRRNLQLIDEDIAAEALAISTSLSTLRDIVDRVEIALSTVESSDLKKIAIQNVSAAISTRIAQIRDAIDDGEDITEYAETYLVDLVAAKAVVSILMSSEDFRGTTVVAPLSNAKTLKTYLTLQGTASLSPRQYIAKGTTGKPFLNYLYASRGGQFSATAMQVSAFLESEQDLTFPLTISLGNAVFDVNGQTESVNLSGTYTDIADLALRYNSISTYTTAFANGQKIRIYAHKLASDPVGKASSIEMLSGDDSVSTGLQILTGERATGALAGTILSDSIVTLSDYTFPTKTITSGTSTFVQYEAFVLTLSGSIHQIVNVDNSANTLTIQPGIPLEKITDPTDGSITYEVSDLSYIVMKTSPGSLFASGTGASTTRTTSDPTGISISSFLPLSAGSTGSTTTSRVREPYNPVQATSTITAQDIGLMAAGTTVQIQADLFELVPNGTPAGPNQFAIGASEVETALNLKNAIDAAESDLSNTLTAAISDSDATVVILTASSTFYPGSSGNSLSTPVVPSGFATTGFTGGSEAGYIWSGLGVAGTLVENIRLSGSDGTNQKESGTATLGAVKWSGTAGIAFKGYGSGTGSQWYASSAGEWGEKLEESTGTAGDAPTPTYDVATNVMNFFGGTAADWTTNDAVVYWDDSSDADIAAGMWFVMTAWAEYDSGGGSGNIAGPTTGVGGLPSTGTSGTGTTFFISAVTGSNKFTLKAPEIDIDGNGTGGELGETWADFGWSTSSPTTSYISMEGYFFDPDKFTSTIPQSFTTTYTTETGTFTPQAGDFIYYEKEVSGTTYRASTAISSIPSSTKAVLQDTGGTNGSNDFLFGRRIDSPSLANYPQQLTGVKYTFVRNVSTAQTRFFVSSASSTTNLSSKGISAGDLLHITSSGSNNGWYIIQSISSDGELLINSAATGNAPDGTAFKTAFSYPETVNWEIVAPDYQQRITDSSATFLTNGVSVGDTMVISSGGFAGNYEIDAVESETSLLVDATTPSYKGGPFTSAGTPSYYVPTNDILGGVSNKFFKSPSSYFYGSVFVGDILTISSTDYVVAAISSADTLELSSNFSSYFSGQAWSIRQGAATSGDYSGQEVTNKFKVDLSANTGLTDLLDVGGIAAGAQIDVDNTSGEDIRDGFLKITSGASIGTYSIESVDAVDGTIQYVYLDEEIPVSAGGDVGTLTWQVLAGTTTDKFDETGSTDSFIFSSTSSSAFYTHPPGAGDTLVISPGEASETRIAIASVDTAKRLTLEEKIDADQTALRYAILPAEYPQIGNELLIGQYRSKITDITVATGGSVESGVLELESIIPIAVGTSNKFFVVSAGADPNTSSIEDTDPDVSHDDSLVLDNGFLTTALGDLVGDRIEISAGPLTFQTTIKRVNSSTSLEMARPIDAAAGEVFYRVMTNTQGKSSKLSYPATISASINTTDTLTIWQVPDAKSELALTYGTTTSGDAYSTIQFNPQSDSGLNNLDFTVTRGGGSGYGRYLLLLAKLPELTTRLDAYKFADLNLRLGEVLSKHGTDKTDVVSSDGTTTPAATAPDDGDGDSLTNRFNVSTSTAHDLGGVRVGDRIEIVYENLTTGVTETYTTWVTLGDVALTTNPLSTYDTISTGFASGRTTCLVSPEIEPTTSTYIIKSWKIQRSSISFALLEATRLRLLLEGLRQITLYYSVETSDRVDAALQLLREEGYDRMASLLTSGQYKEFFEVSYEDGSYQESMKKVMRDIGNLLLDLRNG